MKRNPKPTKQEIAVLFDVLKREGCTCDRPLAQFGAIEPNNEIAVISAPPYSYEFGGDDGVPARKVTVAHQSTCIMFDAGQRLYFALNESDAIGFGAIETAAAKQARRSAERKP